MPLIRNAKPTTETAAAPDSAGLSAADPDVRWRAARALAGQPGASAALGAALAGERDTRVREALFTALIVAGPDGAQVAASYLQSDDAGLRTGALDALRAMGQDVATVLPALLLDSDPDVRGLACDLTRRLPAADASVLLGRVLDADPEPNVCAAAIEVLAEIGGPQDADGLSRCAARFPDQPFLGFAVGIALHSVSAHRSDRA